ncbi:DUF3189 family protein [Fuchsiella alkaliacetigena]|uniref:DUF3189 family protein n=1 Tax=Fuchsiella alkaliacetigena TaxID=957042 RepID=UPI00200A80BB|nr:DUF3189 family protein [Fuchsiella alkaliacetigena]MCK8823930.1 DUF3189 family protein [Fuchsiella alkaliacetigena]
MKIVYYDSTGQYLAVVAAALHLKMISKQESPKWEDLKELAYFDAQNRIELGKLTLIGKDELENDIYILGSGSVAQIIERALLDLNKLLAVEEEFLFVDLTEEESLIFKLALKLKGYSFNFKLVNRLICHSLNSSFSSLITKVEEVEKRLKNSEGNL